MRTLITLLDGITETSMPFNEFVLYRARHYPDEKQILIICGPRSELPRTEIPDMLEIKYAGRNPFAIRRAIRSAVKECARRNSPYVFHLHQVQSGFLAELSMLGTDFRKKTLFTVHSTFSGYAFHNKLLSLANVLPAQRICCVSNTSYQNYPRLIKRIKGARMQVLQNGVDTERIDTVSSLSKECAGVRYLYVARLIPIKNHLFLLDALAMCRENVRIIFVGSGSMEAQLRRRVEELGLADRVIFTGLIPREEVFRLLQSADGYLSSSTLEGLPVSVLEAMYCALPCVLSDIPQHREIGGEAVTLLPLETERFSEEMDKLASLSETQRNELGRKNRDYVARYFSLQAMHKKYDAVYDAL